MFATIIIWASWVIGGIALLLLLAIYVQRIRNAARHSWFERRSKELLPRIYAYLQDEIPLYELKAHIAHFAGAHVMPVGQCFAGIVCTMFCIAQHAANQANVGPANKGSIAVSHLQ